MTQLAHALRKAGITGGDDMLDPRQRAIAWAAEAIARGGPEAARLGFLAGKLKADPTFAALAWLWPGQETELMRALLDHAIPSAKASSPQGAEWGHAARAEEAILGAPRSDMSAPADGREGHKAYAARARVALPSRPAGPLVPVQSHVRNKPGQGTARPLAPVTPRVPRPPRASVASLTAAAAIRTKSLLDTFPVAGRVLGEATGAMCRTVARKNAIEARFLVYVSAGVPDDMRIGAAWTPAQVEEMWQRAVAEVTNAR